jgi:hypothetical protein
MVIQPKPIQYDQKTKWRALVAFACTPFQWQLLAAMRDQSVSLNHISGHLGVAAGYSAKVLPELKAEHLMMWLIQVGMLRREVDGQGLTNSFRLTPLGRAILEEWQAGQIPETIPFGDRTWNHLRCWWSRFAL